VTAPARIAPQLEFFDEQHEYRLDGVKIPSVTAVLSFGQRLDHIPRWTAERGTALHLASEYDDAGDLDESTVDPLVKPHLDAYRKWRARTAPKFANIEVRVWGEIAGRRFAGCIDRVIETERGMEIADLKTGAPRKEHGAQLWAYAWAYEQMWGWGVSRRFGLYLGKDGAYSERDYRSEQDGETFRRALARYYEETKNA
jgi:hypothetical protein